ncbi:hypothetical protein V7147_10155 [Bacillus sp. JJ1521]|uniref:hypothetical protein n=1 Tax=Bacillus sp. JJ1521 TaxID=3122957 RepID=UPI002FFF3FFD
MTTILFIICFALLAVAFFLIILLYLKITQLKDVETKQERLLKEFENVITSYVMEIKEENEVFLNRIKDVKKASKLKQEIVKEDNSKNQANAEIEEIHKKTIHIKEQELTSEDIQELLPSFADQEEIEQNPKQAISENDDSLIEVLFKDIDHLTKLGHSYEEIAKKLNKGKTEIELLHKFRQNN